MLVGFLYLSLCQEILRFFVQYEVAILFSHYQFPFLKKIYGFFKAQFFILRQLSHVFRKDEELVLGGENVLLLFLKRPIHHLYMYR
ncbi:hypothetical protein Fmac_017235 [Flemingia macrophylla]|uniref:Uncharacterized protein n=1 Tax=Flemingia macrophylla TaxID=520843 RepID=A0ABD1M1I6_9FABA